MPLKEEAVSITGNSDIPYSDLQWPATRFTCLRYLLPQTAQERKPLQFDMEPWALP
jgi:hypothetical protein